MLAFRSPGCSPVNILIFGCFLRTVGAVLPGFGRSGNASSIRPSLAATKSKSLAEAHAEVNSSRMARLRMRVWSESGPATLSEYCAGGGEEETHEGEKVKANWHDMGTFYPGKVEHVNDDGTMDILYDDGWLEEGVPGGDVKPIKPAPKAAQNPKDDPACQLQDFVVEVKAKVEDAFKDVNEWMKNGGDPVTEEDAAKEEKAKEEKKEKIDEQVQKRKEKEEAKDEKVKEQAAESGQETDEQVSEVEKLKQELADADEEIKDLQWRVKQKDKELEEELGDETVEEDDDDANAGNQSAVDLLIQRYKKRLTRRQREIERLRERLEEQDRELAAARESGPTLDDISAKVEEISNDVAKAKLKMKKIAQEGEMDPELADMVQGIFQQEQQLRTQMDELIKLQKQAEAAQKLAEQEAKEAKNSEEAAEAEVEAEEAQEAVVKAARAAANDMRAVSASTQELDTGLHPHGEKWWRYRYERSYVEGLLMVMITIMIMFWEYGYEKLRAYMWSQTTAVEYSTLQHGTMFIQWLEYLAGEMMVCLLTFLTVWVLAQLSLFEMFPRVLREDEFMRLPKTGLQYRQIAVDMAVVLFIAIVFYYCLILAVVRATTLKLHTWAEMELSRGDTTARVAEAAATASAGVRGPSILAAARTVAVDKSEYQQLREYFIGHMEHHEDVKELGLQLDHFPFWAYIRLTVRDTTDHLFRFGLRMWILIVLTFCVFCLLHRFAHMGYIRIMMFYGAVTLLLLGAMVFWIHRVNVLVASDVEDIHEATPGCCREYNTETWVTVTLHYLLFFLCYGASRMVCQPWMWELHFYPVLCLTIFTIITAVLFCVVVAPMIPTFAAAMAFPPYVDPDNVKMMLKAAQMEKDSHANFLKAKTTSFEDQA